MKRLLAALIFFTRLPFWRIAQVPAECYKRVVDFWALTGWLTGGIMVSTYWICAMILPVQCAAIAALASRILMTGALHEDGFADFADGFGGGTSRQRILEIMKDSHIGTYGVLALAIYCLLMTSILSSLSVWLVTAAIVGADSWSKLCASQIVNVLPYARKQAEAKNLTVYTPMTAKIRLAGFAAGALPLLFMPPIFWIAAIAPVITAIALFALMKHKIGGYTGDCCGATFILCELSFYIGLSIIAKYAL